MSTRKNPPMIFVGALSNRIYCATRYTKNNDGRFTAHEKFDVTDQVGAALEELDRRGLELRPRSGEVHNETTGASENAR